VRGGAGSLDRDGLPDALRVLLRDYPRDIWTGHGNFDGLTRFWLDRHLGFRSLLDQWQAETRRFLDRNAEARTHAVRSLRLGGALVEGLHGHHGIEDAHYFPMLAGLEPRLAKGFDLLEADHHALDLHLDTLTDATNGHLRALTDSPADTAATAGRVLLELEGFARFLDRHLLDEEELVVPVILHHAVRF
jgi:iron-sulfur cluster repair protein YtfE (RIC family)